MFIRYLNGYKINKTIINQKENVAWIERITDTFVVIKEIIKRKLTIHEYLKTLLLDKESACLNWKDPLPAIMYIVLLPYLYFKR